MIASIHDKDVIQEILTHLNLWDDHSAFGTGVLLIEGRTDQSASGGESLKIHFTKRL